MLDLSLLDPSWPKEASAKMLNDPRRDGTAGSLSFEGQLIPEIGLSIMHASVWLFPCSSRGALAQQRRCRKGKDTRGRQFVHICSCLRSFTVMGSPEEKSRDLSIRSDQYEIIHRIRGILSITSQKCPNKQEKIW